MTGLPRFQEKSYKTHDDILTVMIGTIKMYCSTAD